MNTLSWDVSEFHMCIENAFLLVHVELGKVARKPTFEIFQEGFEFFNLADFSVFKLFFQEYDQWAWEAFSHEQLFSETAFEDDFSEGLFQYSIEFINQVFLFSL